MSLGLVSLLCFEIGLVTEVGLNDPESTNSRVQNFAIFTIVVLIALGVWQVGTRERTNLGKFGADPRYFGTDPAFEIVLQAEILDRLNVAVSPGITKRCNERRRTASLYIHRMVRDGRLHSSNSKSYTI